MKKRFPYTLKELKSKVRSEDDNSLDGGYIRNKYGNPAEWDIDNIQEVFEEYEHLFGVSFEGKPENIQLNDNTLWRAFLAYRKMLAIR
jgi:hypothetical protein